MYWHIAGRQLTTVKRMNDMLCNTVEGYHPRDAGGIVRATGMEDKVTWATNKTEYSKDKNVCSWTQ